MLEISQENVYYEISLQIKTPPLCEKEHGIDWFLHDCLNVWKVWPSGRPLDSCLYLNYITIAIIIKNIVIVLIFTSTSAW